MKTVLHAEGAVIAAVAVWLNYHLGGDWGRFILFLILPDLSLLAYIGYKGTSVWPSRIYNVAHTYAVPLILWLVFWQYSPVYLSGWIAHIGADRLIGYGLKSRGSFKDTHLQRAAEVPSA